MKAVNNWSPRKLNELIAKRLYVNLSIVTTIHVSYVPWLWWLQSAQNDQFLSGSMLTARPVPVPLCLNHLEKHTTDYE